MRGISIESAKPPNRPRKLIRRLILISLLILLGFLVIDRIRRPKIDQNDLKALSRIPIRKTFYIKANKPVKELKLFIDDTKAVSIKLDKPDSTIKFELKPSALGIKEGEKNLTLKVRSGFFWRTYRLKTYIDLTPPALSAARVSSGLLVGSSGAVKVRSEEDATLSLDCPGRKIQLTKISKDEFFGLFPVGLDSPLHFYCTILAKDPAGNISKLEIWMRPRSMRFRQENIELNETTIRRVGVSLIEGANTMSPEEVFIQVNERLRRESFSELEELSSKSLPKKLWQGAFLMPERAQVVSSYGDLRYYILNGKKISESRHMGIDFASFANAPVRAGNSGVVVFARFLGIYGNTVVIDHGLGLMSIYSHLSEIVVKEGQNVAKGQFIGKTGTTGLAFGDHLHFGILVHGYEVNPSFWLSERWVQENIEKVFSGQ
ncbi:MAG: M23 family metallopeptidase [Aquificaceae bacterium]